MPKQSEKTASREADDGLITSAMVKSGDLPILVLQTVERVWKHFETHNMRLDEADKARDTAGSILINIQHRFAKGVFAEFRKKYFPDLAERTAHRRIQHAGMSQKALVDLRGRHAEEQARYRQKLADEKAAREAEVERLRAEAETAKAAAAAAKEAADAAALAAGVAPLGKAPVVKMANGGTLDTSGLGAAAKEQLAKAMAGNAEDAAASAAARMAENAAALGGEGEVVVLADADGDNDNAEGEQPQDASWFYDRTTTTATAATRVCYELVEKRGVSAYDLFGIFADALMPMMNSLTREQACKKATAAKSKANTADKEKRAA